ncbi:MAG: amidohydrolase [Alphaproteobacteria bacterium]|nr:amidohydrolase [Alphaproteobacteria bacterium]
MLKRRNLLFLLGFLAPIAPARGADLPIVDVHIHYSHDAWALTPPADAAAILRKAGIKRALVSSSNDDGNQMLLKEAPDLIWPSLRPYRTRADASGWVRDPAIVGYMEERLKRHRYVAIGEFHVYGADADLPVMRRTVELARQHDLVLHAHGDADAIDRLFAQWPHARVLWAHSGFDQPERLAEMLRKHPRLFADLAFRNEHGSGGQVPAAWRSLFEAFPDRFMVGTDTFTPERWHYVGEHAAWTRAWLATLPRDLAERIAYRNAEALFGHFDPAKTQ